MEIKEPKRKKLSHIDDGRDVPQRCPWVPHRQGALIQPPPPHPRRRCHIAWRRQVLLVVLRPHRPPRSGHHRRRRPPDPEPSHHVVPSHQKISRFRHLWLLKKEAKNKEISVNSRNESSWKKRKIIEVSYCRFHCCRSASSSQRATDCGALIKIGRTLSRRRRNERFWGI